MGSRGIRKLVEARRANAEQEYPELLDSLLNYYLEAAKARNPDVQIDAEQRAKLRTALAETVDRAAR